MKKDELIKQTKIAFDFLDKLYTELSYLIKEVEGLLQEEQEEFQIGRPGGYQVTSRKSSSLDANNVKLWSLNTMSVFFAQKKDLKRSGGTTTTQFVEGLKVIYMRIVLDEPNIKEPYIKIGILYNFMGKGKSTVNKVEQLMGHMEYRYQSVFSDGNQIEFEDSYVKFSGQLIQVNLFDIINSEVVAQYLIKPALTAYRQFPKQAN